MSAMSSKQQITGLAGWLALAFVTGFVGAIASVRAGEFYTSLVRPEWAPPPGVFGPVWSCLYALMGVAAWLTWRGNGFAAARTPLTLFIVQLVVNALWSWLFFAWHMGGAALADIAVLWLLIVATLVGFWHHSRLAAALLVPYLLWVSFAALLNYSVWQLNPQALG